MNLANFKILNKLALTNKNLAISFVLLVFLVATYEYSTSSAVELPNVHADQSIDTMIPVGMTLVPIEILNSQALSELIGSHGVVDLYSPPLHPKDSPKKVVTAVKIMRAPYNPNVYAVLVKDSEAPKIARNTTGYFVTVQNPKTQNFKLEKKKAKQKIQIVSEM